MREITGATATWLQKSLHLSMYSPLHDCYPCDQRYIQTASKNSRNNIDRLAAQFVSVCAYIRAYFEDPSSLVQSSLK